MTLWTSPVPLHLSSKDGVPAPGGGSDSPEDRSSGTSAATGMGMLAPPAATASGARRQTLPTVPSAAAVEQGERKWLEFAPTSPQRRASFVSEPGALEGNPFEIFREPARPDPVLGTQSFYEAGTSYAVKDSSAVTAGAKAPTPPPPVAVAPPPQQQPQQQSAPAAAAVPAKRPEPLLSAGNPFYEAPLSPVRYNKPIAKVELSPSSHALFSAAFSELDPLKRAESPTARIPLEQLKISGHSASSKALGAQQQQQQQQPADQAQAQGEWGAAWPAQQAQQQAAPAFGAASLNASGFAAPQQQQQQQQLQQPAAADGWADFGGGGGGGFGAPAAPVGGPAATISGSTATTTDPFAPWPAQQPQPQLQQQQQAAAPAVDGFEVLAAAGSSSKAAGLRGENEGAIFDPVRQKSLAETSFDLGVGDYFPEDAAGAGHGGAGLDDSQYDGPGEGEHDEHHDEDIDGSFGGENAGFELQDDHLVPGDGEREEASGMYYEVAFTAPSQFGMLLERKDEWTRGAVQRRERTVVTLVVEGGEAEARGVTTGSMIAAINGRDVTALTYKETLEMIKSPARPMRVVFERESLKEEVLQGYFFVSKGPFFSNPTSMDKWKRKYVVLGGPIAKKNVLQIYDSKRAYHNTVVALFQRKRPQYRVKTYALTYAFKLSPMQERKMEGHTAPLKFFAFMTPGARFKSIRVASETKKNVQALHERFGRFAGKR